MSDQAGSDRLNPVSLDDIFWENQVPRLEARDVARFLREPPIHRPLPFRPWPRGELRKWYGYRNYRHLNPETLPNRF